MRVLVLVVAVVVGVGCRPRQPDRPIERVGGTGAPIDAAPELDPVFGVARPAPASQERAVDGRAIVYGDDPLWCYSDALAIWGGRCADSRDSCEKNRRTPIENTFLESLKDLAGGKKVTEMQGAEFETAKRAALEHAVARWPPCESVEVAACYFSKDVLTGFEIRMCGTTIQRCERDRQEFIGNPDVLLRTDGCVIYRVRRR